MHFCSHFVVFLHKEIMVDKSNNKTVSTPVDTISYARVYLKVYKQNAFHCFEENKT